MIMIIFPLFLFIFCVSFFLYQAACIDKLLVSIWKGFLITAPFAFYVSPTLTMIGLCLLCVCPLIWKAVPRFPDFLKYPFQVAHAIYQDFFILPTFFLFFRKRCWRRVQTEYPGEANTPVLLIHGFRHDKGGWIFLAPSLQKSGCGPLYTLDLGSSNQTIEQYALLVKKKLEEIASETGHSEVILLGYSLGGVIAAHYALHLAPPNSVQGILTLASPLDGTWLAFLGHEPCAKQIRAQCAYIRKLRGQIIASSVPFIHVGSTSDTAILPPSSAFIHYPDRENIELQSFGHLALIYSKEIGALIAGLLTKLRVS